TPQHHPQIGIGDDKLDMFSDPRFLALGIKTVRYDMHWDALSMPAFERPLTAWMKAAHEHHLDVLLTIDHSDKFIYKVVKVKEKVHGKTVSVKKRKRFSQSRVLPTPAQYLAAFKAFRKRFPWVKNFVTWDETNFYGEATAKKEGLVASYYREMRHACSSCTILAAEFLDVSKHRAVPVTEWVKKFVKALGYEPGYWGLNDYEDANHLVSTSTRQLLGAVKGKIWLAETGGIVSRPHTSDKTAGFTQSSAHAAKADTYVLKTIGSLSPRIQRIYLYEWDAKTKRDSWDTALISYNHVPRAGYNVLANTLFSWGVKPNCAISIVPPSCKNVGPTGPTGATGSTGASGATGATH
ncbi:MAG TPA: hypothetical protein VFC22_06515, partial [Solirubrobacteraceae bacterium]|nr:hypothetical protein [Solirubrobacteraceae bacterium]